jgi:uncharacterized protein
MDSEQSISTPIGEARISCFETPGPVSAVMVLGHGSATGVESADLQAVAGVLPTQGIAVALITQPYRLAGRGGSES